MGITDYLKKLPRWIQLLVAGIVFIVGQIASAIIQTGSPPNWLANLLAWGSPKLTSAASAFVAETVPLWSVFILGCLVAFGVGASVLVIARKYRDIKRQLDALQRSNGELVQEHSALKEEKDSLAKRLSDFKKAHADASDSLAGVKSQRDDALSEVKRLKSKSPSLLQNFAYTARHDQNPLSTIFGANLPRGLKIRSERESQERSCADVLENVMLCTINESTASINDIQELTSMPRKQLESCLEILNTNNYVQVTRYGISSRYQLTPRARKHFMCKKNGVKSELSFVL